VNEPVSPPLRPLGVGELLDRAVTLCVRFFLPFSLIYLAYGIPLGVVNYFASRGVTTLIQAFADQLKAQSTGGRTDPHALATAMANGGSDPLWSLALIAMTFFISPLAGAALIDATSAASFGRLPTFASAYRTALSRWPNLMGVNLLYVLAGLAIYVAIVVVAVLIVFAIVGITTAVHVVGIVVGVLIGIVFVLFAIAFFLVASIAWQISYFACVVERLNFVASFSSGLARVFGGIGLKRSLLVGLVLMAVGIGIWLVTLAGQGVLIGLLRSSIAGTVFTTLVSVGTAAFLTAFMTTFYFDLRVREDGLDLQLAAHAALDRPLES